MPGKHLVIIAPFVLLVTLSACTSYSTVQSNGFVYQTRDRQTNLFEPAVSEKSVWYRGEWLVCNRGRDCEHTVRGLGDPGPTEPELKELESADSSGDAASGNGHP